MSYLGGPPGVLGEDVAGPAGERVWVLLAEDVAHAAARDDLQRPAALPHPERNLWRARTINKEEGRSFPEIYGYRMRIPRESSRC